MLEQSAIGVAGTAEACRDTLDSYDSEHGWCVGDGDTEPEAAAFDNSPFSIGRGFDIILDRSTMEIVWTSSHGTPNGNENLDGDDVLEAVQVAVAN